MTDDTRACTSLLACPVCVAPLAEAGGSFRCPAGHTFDRARSGYVDLLPVGHGRSGIRGDDRAMVEARRRFLGRGHYRPLADRLVARVAEHVEDRAPGATGGRPVVVEAGCGSGYYLAGLAAALEPLRPCLFGFDVSTPALRLAARAVPGAVLFVNDVSHRICLGDGVADVVLDVFAPRNAAEFGRVLRPDGVALVVVPGEDHLLELRSVLPMLDIEPAKRERTMEKLAPELELAGEESLTIHLELTGSDVADLLRMTPSAWHLDEATIEAAAARGPVEATASFRLLRFSAAGPRPSTRGP